jgi:HK97 family phage portal protein
MYKREKNGSKESASEHWLYSLLHDSPNGDQTAAEFWEGLAVSLCTAGNAYARKEFADDGKRLISLTPLSSEPGQMDVSRDKQGRLRYKYTFRGKAYDDTEEKIFHIRGFGAGGDLGLSPVAYARQTLGLAEAIAHSAGATFKNGMKASVFFTSPAGVKMNNDQRAEFRKAFIDPYIGAEASASAGLLEHGTDVKTVSLPPKDAEMLMSWKFSVEEICRWLRVPPILIGHSAEGQTMWGSGVEQIMLGWLTLGLRPYLTRIEQAVKKRLLSADERKIFFFEFNVEGLLRADSAGRAALYSVMAQNGLKTRNEMRSLENDPPKPGGDDLTVQSNLLPIQMLGKIPPKAVQPAPGEAI